MEKIKEILFDLLDSVKYYEDIVDCLRSLNSSSARETLHYIVYYNYERKEK